MKDKHVMHKSINKNNPDKINKITENRKGNIFPKSPK